jgi:ribonuclease-3
LLPDYENLEFLGDAILDFVISETLLLKYPDRPEGELTKMRASLVSATPLSRISRSLGLGQYLRLSRGEEKTGGRKKRAILADLFESLVAAIYLDGGLPPAREFILVQFESLLGKIDTEDADFRDHKTRLQECLHRHGVTGPRYDVIRETGPDHRKWFLIEASIGKTSLATGEGSSKKSAEQEAARKALHRLSEDDRLLENLSDA